MDNHVNRPVDREEMAVELKLHGRLDQGYKRFAINLFQYDVEKMSFEHMHHVES